MYPMSAPALFIRSRIASNTTRTCSAALRIDWSLLEPGSNSSLTKLTSCSAVIFNPSHDSNSLIPDARVAMYSWLIPSALFFQGITTPRPVGSPMSISISRSDPNGLSGFSASIRS